MRGHYLPVSLLLACACMSAGCNTERPERAAPATAQQGGDPSAPVARLGGTGGEVITKSDLDQKLKTGLGRLETEHAQKVHELKSDTLNEMIEERILAKKAKAEGITADKLIEREVTAKVPTPDDAEVRAVYDRTTASGRTLPPFEQVKADIIRVIKERSGGETRRVYLDKLRAEAKVETLLPPLLLPKIEVAATGPSRGPAKAPITIVEFSDFECPYCVRAEEAVKQVLAAYPDKVRLVYRDYPLPGHARAQKASEAALCAGDQGKYWEMHEKLFANQKQLEIAKLKQHAKDLALDGERFGKCLDSGEKATEVEASKKAGEEAGVTGTPAFFINGRPLTGAQPFEKFKEIIDHEIRAGGG